MNPSTKITLSPQERSLLENPEWILTKNEVVKKAIMLLETVQDHLTALLKSRPCALPEALIRISPKISKGENYLGLPWLMLDFPRNFDKENIFAIRNFFWWGHYFTTTLHLAGEFKKNYQEKLQDHYERLGREGFFISNGDDQWQHDLSHYTRISD